MFKVFCAGSEGYINQIDRVKRGFVENGCLLVDDFRVADLIFCNDPSCFNPKYKKESSAKVVYCILDIPPHLVDGSKYDISRYSFVRHSWKRDFDPSVLAEKLQHCDHVVCICDDVKTQIKDWCGVDSRVVYNPIKDVSWLNLSEESKIKSPVGKKFKYLYVGRANDVNKRFNIVAETILLNGDKPEDIAIVGSENPNFGYYYGVVSDEILNMFYNSCEYLFFPSAFKSIGLPALEAVVCRCVPIVCNDDPTTKEFFEGIGVDSDPSKIAFKINDRDWNMNAKDFVARNSEVYKQKFSSQSVAKNILNCIL